MARLGARVVAAGMVAAPPKTLPPIESILKAHPLVHAAEGELYRRVFAEAGAALGARPHACPPTPSRAARPPPRAYACEADRAAGRDGKGVGKPWAADQKQATLAAWLALASARR